MVIYRLFLIFVLGCSPRVAVDIRPRTAAAAAEAAAAATATAAAAALLQHSNTASANGTGEASSLTLVSEELEAPNCTASLPEVSDDTVLGAIDSTLPSEVAEEACS